QSRDEQGQPLVRAVFSGFKLNQPNEAFLTTGVSISGIRWTGAASVRAFEAGNFAIIPELYGELQGQNYLANLGVAFDWVFQNENPFDPIQDGSIRLATRYTQANVVVLALQIDQPQYQIGFAYDLGVGGNVPRTYQSAFEVGLSFRVNRRPQANAVFVTDYSLGEIRDFYDEEGGQAVPVAGSEERPANANSQRDEEPDERGFFRNPDPVLGDEEGAEVDRSAYTFTLEENFNFGFNEAVLDETAKNRIRQINDLLVSTPNLRLEVVGHTDNVGTRAGNMEVSRRRAQAVKDYLVELGIDPRRVRIVAKGDSSPKYPNDTPLNRSRNRRVEFVISSGG
ncbi:MAG TPA: hypothetical protein DCP28_34980, partial [Cytophagales bacterium]|nr:hypothetical protein [Cytophagales bacterium]